MPIFFMFFMLYTLSPKLDIYTAGNIPIRIEDVCFILILVLSIPKMLSIEWRVPKPIKYYGFFLLSGIISIVINYSHLGVESILFIIRELQYLLWFFIAYAWLVSIRNLPLHVHKISSSMVTVLSIWGLAEYFNIVPKIGKFLGAGERLSINTSGPYEISALLGILILVNRSFFIKCAAFLIMVLTFARISVFAAIYAYIHRSNAKLSYLMVCVSLFSLAVIANVDNYSKYRLFNIPTPQFISDTLEQYWKQLDPVTSPEQYRAVSKVSSSGVISYLTTLDSSFLSFKIRATRWIIILKSTTHSLGGFLFGKGSSAWGLAVDNYYIRVIGEQGIIGLIFFILFITSCYQSFDPEYTLRTVVIFLCIVAFFIDIFVASKIMPFLWTLLACSKVEFNQMKGFSR